MPQPSLQRVLFGPLLSELTLTPDLSGCITRLPLMHIVLDNILATCSPVEKNHYV
jgi:hypothetical protein